MSSRDMEGKNEQQRPDLLSLAVAEGHFEALEELQFRQGNVQHFKVQNIRDLNASTAGVTAAVAGKQDRSSRQK